jgi:PAS domain S-box-containing protein
MAIASSHTPMIKVLLVAGDPRDRQAFTQHVKQAALPYDYTIVDSLEAAANILDLESFNIAILDYSQEAGPSLDLIEQVKRKNLPAIIATAPGNEEMATVLMHHGADGCLIKDPDRHYLKILAATVNQAIARHQAAAQIRCLTQAMQGLRAQIYAELRSSQASLAAQVHQRTEQLQESHDELLEEVRERYKAEVALRISTELIQQQRVFLRSVIDGNPNLIFVKDWEGRFLLANQAIADLHNTTVEALVGKQDVELNVTPEEAARYTQENRQVIETQQELFLPQERVCRAGTGEQWQQWQKRPIQLPDSVEFGVLGIGVNITARKQVELALAASEQSLSTLISNLPGYVFRVRNDPNYTPEFISHGVTDITGYHPDEYMIERSITCGQEIHPEDAEAVWEIVQSAVAKHQIYECEYRLRTKTGQQKWVWERGQGIYGEAGSLLCLEGFVTDVSDRKRAELTLQKLVTGTAAVTGKDFFTALVQHTAEALQVRYAIVTELVKGKLHTLGFWANGTLQAPISYHPAQTPCEYALRDGEFYCHTLVQALFPEDPDLVTMQADSYLGIALKDDQGNGIGNLCILDVQPLEEAQRAEAVDILQVFAARAAAELQRKVADDALRQLNQDLEARVVQRTAELQAQELQLRDFLDNATDLIQSLSAEGRFMFVNRAWKTTLGYTDDDLSRMSIADVVSADQLEHCLTMMQDVLKGHECKGVETTFVTKDGRAIIVEGNVNCRFENGVAIATRGIFRDITARKQTEMLLQQSEQRFRELFEATPTAIQGYDRDRRVIFWNRASEQQYGYSREAAMGHRLEDLIIPLAMQAGVITHMNDWIAGCGSPLPNGEMDLLRQDGQPVTVYASHVLVANAQGEPEMFCIDIDLSDRKQAEAKLQQTNQELARATRLKDEFLANMSHELRTPLNAVLGMTEGLQDEVFGPINEPQRKALQTVERSGSHLLELINDILDVAKIESGQGELDYAPTAITRLCQSSLAFIKHQALKKRIQIATQIPLNLPDLKVDERRLRQVLINLLNNAVKFTPEGGRITLEVALRDPPETDPEARAGLHIAVIDTGIGIAPENIPKLFQPFIQIDRALNRHYQGTGLGLALVKRIVELHGGQVGLTSQVGVGSRFTIALPVTVTASAHRREPQRARSDQPSPPPPAIAPLILLAEDSEINVITLSGYLKARGYRILHAKNGQEAIDLARTQPPDLILMDIQMPEVDGLAATRQIRSDRTLAQMPIIALTALAMIGDRERCLAAGANEYFTKPVKLKLLMSTIQRLLALNHPH